MGRREQIQNEELRKLVDEAFAQLRARQATEAVHTLARCFVHLLELRPELMRRKITAPSGQSFPFLMTWPRLGAELDMAALRSGKPSIVFQRERFAVSDAMTYYEFVLDLLLAEQV